MISNDTDRVIKFMNDLVVIDRQWVESMIRTRLPCNDALAAHPTVQVATESTPAQAGVLGLLNGLCGTFEDGPRKGWGPITAVFDEHQLVGFERTKNE